MPYILHIFFGLDMLHYILCIQFIILYLHMYIYIYTWLVDKIIVILILSCLAFPRLNDTFITDRGRPCTDAPFVTHPGTLKSSQPIEDDPKLCMALSSTYNFVRYSYVGISVYVYIYIHMYMYACINIYIYIYVYTYNYMYICMYKYQYIYIHIFILYIYTYIYIYIYVSFV